jgi:VWFA-related protein
MRVLLTVAMGVFFLAAIPGAAQEGAGASYRIEKLDPSKFLMVVRERNGQQALYVTVQFKIFRVNPDGSTGPVVTDVPTDEIVVKEDGVRVADAEITVPRTQKLTTVLAIDMSGSMASRGKMDEAKKAANTFLSKLDAKADTGLVLFDHEVALKDPARVRPPVRVPARFAQHRRELAALINAVQPRGGTAYLDATVEAVNMLRGVEGRKAVVLMTDGVDMNSKRTLREVIKEARIAEVPVYTLGIGEPGKNEQVSTVLVLDRSGSMRGKANEADNVSKMEALHAAASRFIELMRPSAQTSLLPFSTEVSLPRPFGKNKDSLKQDVLALRPEGGTLLYDAIYTGLETLEAARPAGKRAVVVLTDGMDESPGSRHAEEDVIARARELKVPLHLLGLGRKREINEEAMKRMAAAVPGGSYHHADSQQRLYDIFEKLSIDLHDDGIDEESLKKLAKETGGEYYPARDVSKLQMIYEKLAEELQSTYTVTFPSRRPENDGTARAVDVAVVRGGVEVSTGGSGDYQVHGVVVPIMDHRVYLVFLAVLAGLLLAPAGLRRLYRLYGGA